MLRIIILHKSMLFWISGGKKRQQCFLNNLTVQVCIHGSIKYTDLCGSSDTDACPDVYLHGVFGPDKVFMHNHVLHVCLNTSHYYGTCSASLDNQMHKHCACKTLHRGIPWLVFRWLPMFLQQKRLCVSI